MDIVLDTNILVSGLFWSGKPAKVLKLCKTGQHTNYITPDIFDEIKRVLSYEKFALTEGEITEAMGIILSFSKVIKPVTELIVIKTDPTDNRFIECAISCNAEYIVSGDKHLLELHGYKGIKIVSCSEFLTLSRKHR